MSDKRSENKHDLKGDEKVNMKNDSLQKYADMLGEKLEKGREGKKEAESDSSSDSHVGEGMPDDTTAHSQEYELLEAKLSKTRDELEKSKSDLALMVSENRNQKKRIEKEFRTKLKYLMEDFFKDFILVKDDFDKALSFLPELDDDNNGKGYESFIDGIRMIDKNIAVLMKKYDVESFSAEGEQFDPSMHQAMRRVETDEVEPGTVTAEYTNGYMYGERLLRAAMVEVVVAPEQEEDKSRTGEHAKNTNGDETPDDEKLDGNTDNTTETTED